jgi:hypothetical protein
LGEYTGCIFRFDANFNHNLKISILIFIFFLGATALGEPWPPLPSVSTILYSSCFYPVTFLFFKSLSTSSIHLVFLFFFGI